MKKRTLAVIALAVIAFAGCLKNDGGTSDPRAGILVDLLSPDATNTTIYLNGNVIGTNVSYGSVPNYYNQVTPGAGNLSIFNSSTTQLLNYNFNATSGDFYSLFAVDSVSKMKVIMVKDSGVAYPTTTDSVKVRFYNFAANSQAMSVGIKDSGKIWMMRSFETQSSANAFNEFKGMKSGTYTFEIFDPFSATPIKDTTIKLDGKHIYTLFMKGFYPDTTGTTSIGLGIVKHG